MAPIVDIHVDASSSVSAAEAVQGGLTLGFAMHLVNLLTGAWLLTAQTTDSRKSVEPKLFAENQNCTEH